TLERAAVAVRRQGEALDHASVDCCVGGETEPMMTVPPGVKIHLALGFTDMRKSFDGLSMTVQEVLKEDPFSGHLFVFRGRKSDMIRILFWDGNGMCLFSKRLEQGYFV